MKDELLTIKGLGSVALSKLKSSGIVTMQDFADADISKLANETGISELKLRGWQAEAQNLLGLSPSDNFPGIDELVQELSKKDVSEDKEDYTADVISAAENIDDILGTFSEEIEETAPKAEPTIAKQHETAKAEEKPRPPKTDISAEDQPKELLEKTEIQKKPEEPLAESFEEPISSIEEEPLIVDLTSNKGKKKEKPKKEVLKPASANSKAAAITLFTLLIVISAVVFILPTYKNYYYTSKAIKYLFLEINSPTFKNRKSDYYMKKIHYTFKNSIKISMALLATKRYEDAIRLLKKAEKMKPKSPLPNNLLAETYLKLNNYGAAYIQTTYVMEKVPGNIEVHKVLGIYYLKIGDLQKAYREFLLFLQKKPRDAAGNLNMAKVLIKMGKTDKENGARHFLSLALKYAKNDIISSSIFEELGDIYLKENDLQAAIKSYKNAIKQNPQNLNVRNKLANTMFKTGNIKDAENEARNILLENEKYFKAYVLLGKIYFKRGKFDESENYFKQAQAHDFNNPSAGWYLARIYYMRGDFANADVFLKRSIIIGINDPKIYYYLAFISHTNGNDERAYNYLKQVESSFANDYNFYSFMASLSFKLKHIDESLKYYKICEMLNNNDGTVYNNLGVISELNKNYKAAEEYYFDAQQIIAPKGTAYAVHFSPAQLSKVPEIRNAQIVRDNYNRVMDKNYIRSFKNAQDKVIFTPFKYPSSVTPPK